MKKNGIEKIKHCEAETENGRIVISVPVSLKSMLKPKQRIWSPFVRRIAEKVSSQSSFRGGEDILNDFLHRESDEEKINLSNIHDILQQDGELCEKMDMEYVSKVFESTEWISADGIVRDKSKVPQNILQPQISEESKAYVKSKIDEAVKQFNEGKPDESQIKYNSILEAFDYHPSDMVIISVDTILFPFQKDIGMLMGKQEPSAKKNESVLQMEL